ncbi:MAG: hypothetical protein H6983_24610 [Ectothiorhodospiraceae bacterium]|nr:hypothetical protein [Chromatiales bacterium]MCP5157382.1 hypothetical protein [Ectothiorhodospiraceae bacterium]
MKLHSQRTTELNRLAGYGEGYFLVNEERVDGHVIVAADALIRDISIDPCAPEVVDAATVDALLALDPELVLVGTGARHRFPPPDVLARFAARGCGVEVMRSDAACRTFNIVASEGRRVVALLIAIEG